MEERIMSCANREYKDSVFTLLFKDKKNLISLYNALENKNYPLDTEIKINTLDEVFFKNQRNDLSFLIDNKFIVLNRTSVNDKRQHAIEAFIVCCQTL